MSLQEPVASHLLTKRKWSSYDQLEDSLEGKAHRIPILSEEVREAKAPKQSSLQISPLAAFPIPLLLEQHIP